MAEKESSRLTLTGLAAVIDERDKRYDVIFAGLKESLAIAVAAINKQTEAAFRASQTAIDKAELSQKQYNEEHNSLTKRMVGVEKYDSDQKTLTEKIDELKVSVNDIQVKIGVGSGKEFQSEKTRIDNQWLSLVIISVINIVVFVLIRVFIKGG